MLFRTTAFKVFVLLLVLSVLQIYYYYPTLPETVASHFGPGGEADGWSSKGDFMLIYAITFFAIAAIFLGITWFLPKIPPSLVNLPNKDYWLADERKNATYALLANYVLWFTNATLAFIMVVMNMTIRANIYRTNELGDSFWLLLILYLLFTAVWCVYLFRSFGKPRTPEKTV